MLLPGRFPRAWCPCWRIVPNTRFAGAMKRSWANGPKPHFPSSDLVVWLEALQFFSGFGLAAWILLDHISRTPAILPVFCFSSYWALNLPFIGQEIAEVAWQYPTLRNRTLRLLEPLSAPQDTGKRKNISSRPLLAQRRSLLRKKPSQR